MEAETLSLRENIKEESDYECHTIKKEVVEEEENDLPPVILRERTSFSDTADDGSQYCEKCLMQNEESCPEHGPPVHLYNAEAGEGCSPYSGIQAQVTFDKDRQSPDEEKIQQSGVFSAHSDDAETLPNKDISDTNQMFSVWKMDTDLDVAGTSWGLQGNFEGKPHQEIHNLGRPFICDLCGSGFAKPSALVAHVRSHTGEKPYKCDVCGVGFSVNGNLKAHKRTHTEEKPYKCDSCGAGFNESGTLITHKRTHTGEKPYICDICGGGFSQRGNLKAHRRTHAVQTPFKCNVCGSGFTQNASMIEYKRTDKGEDHYMCHVCGNTQINAKTGAGNKPYKCDACGAAFCHLSNLKAHKRTHTGEKPYKCDVCTSGFARSGHLKRHKVIHTRDKTSKKKAQAEQTNATN